MTLRCINKYISETALKWFVAGCASKWTTFFFCWQAVSWSLSAASVQNSLSLIFSFGYIFLCYLMTCWKRTQCVPVADLDLFNHWQSENIELWVIGILYKCHRWSFGACVPTTPAMWDRHKVWVTLFIEFNSSWAAKTPYQSSGVCPGGRVHWPQMPESYQPALAAQLHPRQGQGAKLDTWLSQYEHSETISALAHFKCFLETLLFSFWHSQSRVEVLWEQPAIECFGLCTSFGLEKIR